MSLGVGDVVVLCAIAACALFFAYERGYRRGLRVGVGRANADRLREIAAVACVKAKARSKKTLSMQKRGA